MVTRSIVGRFLILAVLLVSLGVIAQAALIISREPGRTAAKADATRGVVAVASLATTPANAATPDQRPAAVAAPAQAAEAAPVRVVYPGPLGDAPAPVRKITDAAPAVPLGAAPAVPVQTASFAAPIPATAPVAVPPVGAAPQATTALDPTPAAAAPPAPVVVAAAESDTQPAADTGTGHGINLNNASVDALNHLGGGHIGQTIVKHRPYRSVEDLVKKRVVRRSVYEQIKNQVAAD